jgi:hypothetical protein
MNWVQMLLSANHAIIVFLEMCKCVNIHIGTLANMLLCSWALGFLGTWALGQMGSWALVHLVFWALGIIWALGQLGSWAHGILGTWALGQSGTPLIFLKIAVGNPNF